MPPAADSRWVTVLAPDERAHASGSCVVSFVDTVCQSILAATQQRCSGTPDLKTPLGPQPSGRDSSVVKQKVDSIGVTGTGPVGDETKGQGEGGAVNDVGHWLNSLFRSKQAPG